MRRTLLVLGLLPLLASLAASLGPSAEPLAFTAAVPSRFGGDVEATATDPWLVMEGPSTIHVYADAHAVLHQVTASYVRVGDDLMKTSETELSTPLGPVGGLLDLESNGPTFTVHARASEARIVSLTDAPQAAQAWTSSNVQVGLVLAPREIAPPRPMRDTQTVDALAAIPEGLIETRLTPATLVATGATLLLQDVTLRLGGAPYTVASQVTTVALPTGDHVTESLSFLTIEDATLRVSADRVVLASRDVRLIVDGVASFPWATGQIGEGDAARRLEDERLTLQGSLDLRTLGVHPGNALALAWFGHGDLDLVHVGPTPTPNRGPQAVALAATAAGVGGALTLAWFSPYLKYALTGLVAPLYARLPRDRILDHRGREVVYALVQGEPGVSTHKLASQVEFSWSTLAYHLRVLEKNGKVAAVRDGRHKRFFDRENPAFANGRKGVLAVLRNDQTRAIGEAVRGAPGLSQKDLTERFDLSPSSVHWHVERLGAVGLLEKRRDGHHVRHYPGHAWAEVPEPGAQAVPPGFVAPNVRAEPADDPATA